jgi:hypothetical protein
MVAALAVASGAIAAFWGRIKQALSSGRSARTDEPTQS